jgi:hypothetical protein
MITPQPDRPPDITIVKTAQQLEGILDDLRAVYRQADGLSEMDDDLFLHVFGAINLAIAEIVRSVSSGRPEVLAEMLRIRDRNQ